MSDHFTLQNSLYAFPYHHIPYLNLASGEAGISRSLGWGLEYLCYQSHVAEQIKKLSPNSVLEVGCGDGFLIGGLSQISKRVGVDFSERAIAFGKAFFPDCEFLVGRSSDVDGKFDVVAAVEVLEHVPDSEVSQFFVDMFECLFPGGTAIITVPTSIIPMNPKHYRHYDEDLFIRQLEGSGVNFEIITMERIFRKSSIETLVSKLVSNSFFSLEIKKLTRWAWRYVWDNCRYADATNGRHLVITLRKAT